MPLVPGRPFPGLAGYMVDQLIGTGGFARVYLLKHTGFLNPRAAKELLPKAALDPDIVAGFKLEAANLDKLRHGPHIIGFVHYLQTPDGEPVLVMEYAAGGSLESRLTPGVPMDPKAVLVMADGISAALLYCHRHKRIHRDVKPQNILYEAEPQSIIPGANNDEYVLLGDFGLVRTAHHTQTMEFMSAIGTAEYIAPEALKHAPRDSSDQYALASVIWQAFAGKVYYEGDPMAVVAQQLSADPVPRLPSSALLGEEVGDVLGRALSKEYSARYPDVRTFYLALEAVLNPKPATISSVAPTFQPLPSTVSLQSAKWSMSSKTVKLVDTRQLGNNEQPTTVQFSSDGDLLVWSTGNRVYGYNVNTRQSLVSGKDGKTDGILISGSFGAQVRGMQFDEFNSKLWVCDGSTILTLLHLEHLALGGTGSNSIVAAEAIDTHRGVEHMAVSGRRIATGMPKHNVVQVHSIMPGVYGQVQDEFRDARPSFLGVDALAWYWNDLLISAHDDTFSRLYVWKDLYIAKHREFYDPDVEVIASQEADPAIPPSTKRAMIPFSKIAVNEQLNVIATMNSREVRIISGRSIFQKAIRVAIRDHCIMDTCWVGNLLAVSSGHVNSPIEVRTVTLFDTLGNHVLRIGIEGTGSWSGNVHIAWSAQASCLACAYQSAVNIYHIS